MQAYWGILAPLIAAAITAAAMQVAVILTGALRARDYRRFENMNADAVARQFPLPPSDGSAAEKRRAAFSPFLDKAHKASNAAQTIYHNAVVRSAGCLMLAFLALAIGTLNPAGWAQRWNFDAHSFELLLSWLDVIALLSVLLLFFYGSRMCAPWIASRSGTELLRQYQILNVVIPDPAAAAAGVDARAGFQSEAELIAARVQTGEPAAIVARVQAFWRDRRDALERRPLYDEDVTVDGLIVYLGKRARRQLVWFADSKARLEDIAERRKIVLLCLYVVTAVLALIKHGAFLHGDVPPAYLQALLLVVTGLSAAMTAYYINQNSRSLIHRYNTQQRTMTAWMTAFDARWNFAALPSASFDAAAKSDIRARILQFEDMMIEELIDWIQITSHDAIELAP